MTTAPTVFQKRNDLLGPRVVKALQARHFEAFYCSNSEEAVEKILSLIPEGDTVSWGGSETIREIGLTAKIHEGVSEGTFSVIDRDTAGTPEEKMQLAREALLCDTYLSSANAISEDGCMVNVDGVGNRVAAIAFGPSQVIIVAGMNKVVKSQADALIRARTYASPLNVQRFDLKTPCMATGACEDCQSTGCVCSFIVTMRNCRPAGRVKVVLVGENLGF